MPLLIEALENFSSQLPRGGRVLCVDPEVEAWLAPRGFEVTRLDPSAKDLRFLSLPREQLDGIWAGESLTSFPIEEAQRVVATFFQALKRHPNHLGGVLFVVHPYGSEAFASLLRQNGFQIRLQGQNGPRLAAVCRRI